MSALQIAKVVVSGKSEMRTGHSDLGLVVGRKKDDESTEGVFKSRSGLDQHGDMGAN